jgi:formate dehydrogenase subunit beta
MIMATRKLLMVETHGPLPAMRQLLASLWPHRKLSGMLIPTWTRSGRTMKATLLTSAESLLSADPFAPVMPMNAASEAAHVLSRRPPGTICLVLRPCELRSLRELARRQALPLSDTILVSSDCLAVLPQDDFEWRHATQADPDQITRNALHFAAQGGILPSRLRPNCQLCDQPYPEDADLHIQVFGLETTKQVILETLDDELLSALEADGLDLRPVTPEIEERRERVMERLVSWRRQVRAYAESHLTQDQASLPSLIEHLRLCEACRRRLGGYCPLFEQAWTGSADEGMESRVASWLVACGGCGMCDYTCPTGYPLFTVIGSLTHRLTEQPH